MCRRRQSPKQFGKCASAAIRSSNEMAGKILQGGKTIVRWMNDTLGDGVGRWCRRRAPAAAGIVLSAVLIGPLAAEQSAIDTEACFGPDNGQRIEACTNLLSAPLLDSERSLAYAMRALAYSLRGNYDLALPDYDEALRITPDFAIALNNRAWAYYKSGEPERGLADVEKALRLSPTSSHALDTRAHIRQAIGDAEGALEDYKRAMVFGGTRIVRLYQCGLQAQGHYLGTLTGVMTHDVIDAMRACVSQEGCDPLPPDEECRKLTS